MSSEVISASSGALLLCMYNLWLCFITNEEIGSEPLLNITIFFGKHLIFSLSKTVNFTFAQMLDLLGRKIDINIFCSRWNLNCEQYNLGELKWLLLTWAMWFLCVDISTSLAQQIQGESGRLWGKSFCVKAFEYLFFMISIPSAEVQSLRERRKGKGGIITLMMRWHRTYFGEHFWFFTHFPKLRQIYPEAIAGIP